MSRATSLSVIAVGAIFAFAITGSPGFLNLQVVGWILMATGVAGLLLQRRSRDWLRRTVIVRGSPDASRFTRRKRTQIAAPVPAEPASPDHPTQPLGETAGHDTAGHDTAGRETEHQTVERETIEEYIEP